MYTIGKMNLGIEKYGRVSKMGCAGLEVLECFQNPMHRLAVMV